MLPKLNFQKVTCTECNGEKRIIKTIIQPDTVVYASNVTEIKYDCQKCNQAGFYYEAEHCDNATSIIGDFSDPIITKFRMYTTTKGGLYRLIMLNDNDDECLIIYPNDNGISAI